MKDSVKYLITAVVAIVIIVALSLVVKSGNDRFSQTLEQLNGTLTTQPVASQPVVNSTYPVVDVVIDNSTAVAQPGGMVPTTNIPAPPSTNPVAAPSTDAPAPSTDAVAQPSNGAPAVVGNNPETLAYLNNAVNTMRNLQDFTAVQKQDIKISLTDCSLPAFTSVINGVIESMMGYEEYTYTFTNGTAIDPEDNVQVTPRTAIPPTDKDFTLLADGIVSLTSEASGTNTIYTIVLKPEVSTLDNPTPPYHGNTMDCFSFADLDLPITVTTANFNYQGATIKLTIDEQGRLVEYFEHMPLDGTGGGNMGFLSATATIEGHLDETWTVMY